MVAAVIGRVCIHSLAVEGNKLGKITVFVHILLCYGEGVSVHYHLGKFLKGVFILILILHLVSGSIVDCHNILEFVPVAAVVVTELSGVSELKNAFLDISEVVVFADSCFIVLTYEISIRQQPLGYFIFSVRQLIRYGDFAVFRKLKGVVRTL